MKLTIDEGRKATPNPTLDISDVPTALGTVSICVDEWPSCEGMSAAVEISRDDAKKICEHLISVFGLLTLSPYGDAEKKPGSPKAEPAQIPERAMLRYISALPEPDLFCESKISDPVGSDAFYSARTVVALLLRQHATVTANVGIERHARTEER